MKEREYLRDKLVVTETQCDLGKYRTKYIVRDMKNCSKENILSVIDLHKDLIIRQFSQLTFL